MMNLDQAINHMAQGGKVKVLGMAGYYFMDKGEVCMLNHVGDIIKPESSPLSGYITTDGTLEFDFALSALRAGKAVRRRIWSEGIYIKLQTPEKSFLMSLPYIYIRTKTGDMVPTTPNISDLLASDWEIYNLES